MAEHMKTDDSVLEYAWPDPQSNGWPRAWKQVADQLAEQLEGLLVHFGNEDQIRGARAALEAHENFTFYDERHGTGKKNAESVPVVYDLDPETGEATGTVHPFCSDECRAAYTPDGSHAFGREDAVTNFGFVPKCETCGAFVVNDADQEAL